MTFHPDVQQAQSVSPEAFRFAYLGEGVLSALRSISSLLTPLWMRE